MSQPSPGAQGRIGKQIVLPWSKAIEIAAKSIKTRFWRSMITMSSIVLAIAFLMSIWTSTAIVASLAIGPERDIEAVKRDLHAVYATLLTEWRGLARSAIDRAPGAPSADEAKKQLAKPIEQAVKAAERQVATKRQAMADAPEDERGKLQSEIAALQAKMEPDNQLRLLLDYVDSELATLAEGERPVTPASPDAIKSLYASDIRVALRWKDQEVHERTRARSKRGKSKDEQKKLQAEIDALNEAAKPENRIQFLHDHFARMRRNLEAMRGAVDGRLQQERTAAAATGEEAEGAKPEKQSATPARASLLDFIRQMTPTDTWLAILALLVCLVGIANAMFMTVQERFREIGTMKCLGALDGFIVKLFLLESAALGFIGTLAGILLGMLLATARQLWTYRLPTLLYYPLGNIFVAGVLAAIIGLVLSITAAIFPAQKAARMEPVEAMRVEE